LKTGDWTAEDPCQDQAVFRGAQCGTFYGPVVFRAMVVVGEGVINMVYWYSEDFPFIAFDIREEESI